MTTLSKYGYDCRLWGHEPGFRATIGDEQVTVQVHRPGESTETRRHRDPVLPAAKVPLRVSLSAKLPADHPCLWDDGDIKLTARIGEIVAAIISAGEARYRLGIQERLDRIADARRWHEERRRAAEAADNAKRLAALRQSAELLREANAVRELVAAVRNAIAGGARQVDPADLIEWERWAQAEADRLDPVVSGQVDEHFPLRSR